MGEIVDVRDLQPGMFVAELDRPWLGTPFLVQGFVIESDEELAALRRLCRSVTVDRERSVGAAHRDTLHQAFQAEKRPAALPPLPAAAAPVYRSTRLTGIAPLILAGERRLAGRAFSRVRYETDARVEDELPTARVAYQNARILLDDLAEQVAKGRVTEMEHVESTIAGLVGHVVRNPDTLIWLVKLKRSDSQTYDHALSVAIHLMAFGRNLGLSPDDLHTLGVGGLLKDIGIIRVPETLLHKPGGLTPSERAQVREHVAHGMRMLADEVNLGFDVLDIVRNHHERLDGSGYPRQLRGDEIGLYAEMAGLVDSYCAMMSERPYRPPRDSRWLIGEINRMRGTRFTGPVVDEFVQFVGLYPVGTLVELNSGEVGVVFEQNRVRRLKPRILLLLGPDKTPYRSPGILNLLCDPLVREGLPYHIVRILPAGAYGLDPREYYL